MKAGYISTGGAARTRLWWVVRAVVTLHATAVLIQAVLAGRFLAGDYDMVAAHAANATVLGTIGYAQLLATVLYWRPGRGPGWPALVSLAVSAAETIQILLGYLRVIGVHVPLGVAIISTVVVLLVWAWRPATTTAGREVR